MCFLILQKGFGLCDDSFGEVSGLFFEFLELLIFVTEQFDVFFEFGDEMLLVFGFLSDGFVLVQIHEAVGHVCVGKVFAHGLRLNIQKV